MTLSKVCLRAKDAACRAGSGSAQAPKRVPCGAYDGRVRARADVVRVQADILGRDICPLERCATVLLKDVAEHYEGFGAGSWKTRTVHGAVSTGEGVYRECDNAAYLQAGGRCLLRGLPNRRSRALGDG